MDSTAIKVHQDGCENGKQSIGRTKGGLNTKLHVLLANEDTVTNFNLSAGNCYDFHEGIDLLQFTGRIGEHLPLLMDRAYEENALRETAISLGYIPIVPPKKNRKIPW